MSYLYVQNPKNGENVNIFTKLGQNILKNYIKQLGGHNGPCAIAKSGRCAKAPIGDGNCTLQNGRCVMKAAGAVKKAAVAPKKASPKKAAGAPKKSALRIAKFFDIAQELQSSSLDIIVRQKGINPGDIIFVGVDELYPTRPEYGITFYYSELTMSSRELRQIKDGKIFYSALSIENIKDYASELFPSVKYDKALKDLVKWGQKFPKNPSNRVPGFPLTNEWIPYEAPKKAAAAPKKAAAAPKKAATAPKKAAAAPKKAAAAHKKAERGCVEVTKENGFSDSEVAKYQKRKSPPYPANNCLEGTVMKGKDGDYIAKANKNGVNTWQKLK